jgi:hypothetical protein
MLMRAIKWDDGKVVALGERGEKIPELCGPYELVGIKVSREAGEETKLFKGLSRYGITEPIRRDEW